MEISDYEKTLADQVRSTSVFEFACPAEYLEYSKKVQRKKLSVPTRAGDTVVYMTRRKNNKKKALVHIYLHGGGFCREHSSRDDFFCAKIADITGGIVLDIDYRLAPEYKFPTALRETYDVTKWVFEHLEKLGGDPENVTMSGYSAGGNLICAANMLACDSGEFRVRRQILCYPALDLFTDPVKKPQLPSAGKQIPDERSRIFALLYLGGKEMAASPYASPVFAADEVLRALPDTVLITGGMDGLYFEADDFTKRMVACCGTVTLKCFEHSRHSFIINCLDEWQEAQQMIIDFVRE
jgi:acetyl esterase